MGSARKDIDTRDIVNKISLIAAAITFLIWLLIGKLRPNLVNRVTLRLQVVIALIDVIRHASAYNTRQANDFLCDIIGASVNFSDNIYIAFNVLLAANAHVIFVSRRRPKKTFYAVYTLFMLMFFMVLALCYYNNGSYGRNASGLCNFKEWNGRLATRLYMMYLIEVPGVLYCGYVVFLVMFKFKKRMSNIKVTRNCEYNRVEEGNSEPSRYVGALYWRMSMYPISCFVTMLPFLIAMALIDFGVKWPMWFSYTYKFFKRLPGTTNFLFMLYDPHFQVAFKEFIVYVKNKYYKHTRGDEQYELDEQGHTEHSIEDLSWYHQVCERDLWKVEFDDGYKMSLRDHIKYL